MGNFFNNEKGTLKAQYFSYLNKLKSNHLNSILNNDNNNKMALQKKDFEKMRQIKLSFNENIKIKDIKWIVYISKYFRKKYREGSNWYKKIIEKISKEDFLSEMHYQSFAFYKDFEMKYKSKCLQNLERKTEKEEIDKEEEILNKISRNSLIDLSRNSKIDLSGITDNYGGSFANFKEEMELGEEDIGFKTKKKLKEFIKILKRHLNMEDHPINIIISIYCKYFSLNLANQIESFIDMKNKNEFDFEKKINYFSGQIVDDLKKFIIKIQTTAKLFYCKSINLEFFLEEKDELINLITSIIFVKENIYKNIYSLFEMQFQNEVNDFKYKLNLVKDTKPIDLNIPYKLSLDENTSKEILKLKEEFKQDHDKEFFNINNKIFVPEDGYIKGFHNKNKIDGYNTVVTIIHGLKHAKTPFEKMMIIASMSTEITQCVDTYWNEIDTYLPNYYLSINADEFLSLFIFVVIKAQFPELIIHEKIIQFFTTKSTKSSTIGYYNVTLNAAIEYIKNEAPKDIKENEDTNRLRNSAHLISKYLNQNSNKNKESDEFILIDSKGKNINSNNFNINRQSLPPILSKNTFPKINDKKKDKNLLGIGIEEEDDKNLELIFKNLDDDE